MMFRAVVFDMDGLMFDTERLCFDAWERAGQCLGWPITRELVAQTLGMNPMDTRRLYLDTFGVEFDFDAAWREKTLLVDAAIDAQGVPIKDGLFELLDWLAVRDIPRAVASSSPEATVQALLRKAEIADRFDALVSGDQIAHGKPAPDIYRVACEMLSLAPNLCLALEDSALGIQSASAAGLSAIYVPDLDSLDKATAPLVFATCASLREVVKLLEDDAPR